MKIRRNKVLAFFLTLVMFSTTAVAQPAMMQRPLDTVFLMELAQRLADRGEYDEARGILDELHRTEPDNKAVGELLAKVSTAPKPAAAAPVQPADIAADIAAIQSNIQRHERRNRDLEYLIRQLVAENDVLAQTLAKRNRDLLELMKKVYGENAKLPELNIVTDVEKTRQIMNGYQEQIVERDRKMISRNEELAGLMQEINDLNDEIIKTKNKISVAKSSVKKSDSSPVEDLAPVKKTASRMNSTDDVSSAHSAAGGVTSASNATTKISLSGPVKSPALQETADEPADAAPVKEDSMADHKPVKRINSADLEKPKPAAKTSPVSEKASETPSVSSVSENKPASTMKREIDDEANADDAASTPAVDHPKPQIKVSQIPIHKDTVKAVSAPVKPVETAAPVAQAKPSPTNPVAPSAPQIAALKPAEALPPAPSKDTEKLVEELKAKREFLIEKSMSVLKKSIELEQLQADISKSSGAMKEMEAKYVGIIKDYDTKIQNLKESWAQDKSRQQQEIYGLRDQLLTQTKEISRLQNVITQQTVLLEQHKQGLAKKDQSIANTDEAILAKDQELLKLKSLLKAQENTITLQKVKIGEQTDLINFVDDKTSDLRKRTVVIRQSLTDGDRTLLQLKARVAQLKMQVQGISAVPLENPELTQQVSDLRKRLDRALHDVREKQAVIDDLRTQLEENQKTSTQAPAAAPAPVMDESKLEDLERRLQEARSGEKDLRNQLDETGRQVRDREQTINDLKKQLEENKSISREKDTALAVQQTKITDLETKLKDSRVSEEDAKAKLDAARQKMEVLAENAESFKANAATASQRAADLSEQVYNLEERLQKATGDTAQEMRFLKETLDARDKEVVAIKKEILAKDEELKYFYSRMADATKALKGNTFNQDQTPTSPSWTSKVDVNAASGEAPWDPKNNDAYALQQRLAISAKELQAARHELVARDAAVSQLQAQLKETQTQLKEQKDDYTKILSAEAAREQSKKMRVRDESLYAVGLDQKLTKAREELNNITREVEGYKKNVGQLTEELRSKEKTVQTLNSELEAKNKELTDYRLQIKEKNEQIDLAKQAVEHETQRFESLKKQLDEANRIVHVSETSFAAKDLSIQDLQTRLNNATVRERDYKAQISDLESHMKESYKMVKEGEGRLNDLKSQLGAKESKITALQKDIERLKKLLRERSNDLKS